MAIYFYDRFVYRKACDKFRSFAIVMSTDDWKKAMDCMKIIEINNGFFAVIASVIAFILWPIILVVMEVKRHIANKIFKKYRRK